MQLVTLPSCPDLNVVVLFKQSIHIALFDGRNSFLHFQMDDDPLIPPEIEVDVKRVSLYRWLILTIFALFSLLQSGVWDTWGPISPSATQALGFTERKIGSMYYTQLHL